MVVKLILSAVVDPGFLKGGGGGGACLLSLRRQINSPRKQKVGGVIQRGDTTHTIDPPMHDLL